MKLFTSFELTQDTPVCNITSLESTLYHPTPLTVLVLSLSKIVLFINILLNNPVIFRQKLQKS